MATEFCIPGWFSQKYVLRKEKYLQMKMIFGVMSTRFLLNHLQLNKMGKLKTLAR